MTNDEIEPMVPVMPRQASSSGIVTDGGRQRRYAAAEVEAPLVPRF
jgi:hypothetical protein